MLNGNNNPQPIENPYNPYSHDLGPLTRANHYSRVRPFNHRQDSRVYEPRVLYTNEITDMTGPPYRDLANAFVNTRTLTNGTRPGHHNAYSNNAGAGQLFNYYTHTPLTHAIGGVSIPINYGIIGYSTTYGHSEKRIMKNLLDNFIDQHYSSGPLNNRRVDEGVPPRPVDLRRYPNVYENGIKENLDREDLYNLTRWSNDYKRLMENERYPAVVKMWSERPACREGVHAGMNCHNFTEAIFPKGSKYGSLLTRDEASNRHSLTTVKDKQDRLYDVSRVPPPDPLPHLDDYREQLQSLQGSYNNRHQHERGLFRYYYDTLNDRYQNLPSSQLVNNAQRLTDSYLNLANTYRLHPNILRRNHIMNHNYYTWRQYPQQ